jgi:hypothetical protein
MLVHGLRVQWQRSHWTMQTPLPLPVQCHDSGHKLPNRPRALHRTLLLLPLVGLKPRAHGQAYFLQKANASLVCRTSKFRHLVRADD